MNRVILDSLFVVWIAGLEIIIRIIDIRILCDKILNIVDMSLCFIIDPKLGGWYLGN